ncbi:phosphopantetheinyl transferase [Blattabacterium punctulatus]|uniref:Phosphopantetheinyl transferase n=1 Tax=Blattabacterium punctulatus TaxID=164514 RepID=A0ABM6WMS9_9FLAO|nr:4'-phosphopantetheinyl transferase superfamily protein [Blattabacterium punctulatus]AWU39891.1 phosphopantetheinyl transferase [Blattabacterium punctulatus]AWU40436.1 phosphopantetheinyl transferase [Blattabacterium punctulatus]AWU43236.1 phosphopantetheinyl transferase [Blattabacterium punctulatus]
MFILNKFNHIHTKIIVFRCKHLKTMLLEKFIFSDKERKFFLSLSEKRKKEFLGVRYALRYIGINMNLLYNEKRKPFLFPTKGKYISLSHSFELISIAISSYPIGIDIEKLRKDQKIIKIKKKFVRNDESVFIHPNYEEDYLHIIWGIKESLYKLEGGESSNFLNHYKVSPFFIKKDSCISCWIIKNSYSKRFSAFYRKIDNHYLVYIIDDK